MSARSSLRIRSRRSSDRSRTSLSHQGPVISPRPTTVISMAARPTPTAEMPARARISTAPAITRLIPAITRSAPIRSPAEADSDERDSRRQRSRSVSEACRQSNATPKQASTEGRNHQPSGRVCTLNSSTSTVASAAPTNRAADRIGPSGLASGAVGNTIQNAP